MTKRSVGIGLLMAMLVGAGGQYAQKYIPGTWGLIRGHLPVSVFGALIFFVMAVNPLLGALCRSWRLRAGEIALIMALALAGCGIADGGMMRYFPRQLITPIRQEQTKAGWRESEVLRHTPPAMLANSGEYNDAVVEGFFSASAEPDGVLPFRAVPWDAWRQSLAVWTALIALFMIANVCLGVIVHRQWADKERLRYPLAEIASSLLRTDAEGKTVLLRNRLFWLGMAVPFAIRMINYMQNWFPNSIEIPLAFDFSAMHDAFPEFMRTPGAGHFARPTIFPVCVGLAFLLASDIGLSLGVANVLSVFGMYLMIGFGMNLSGSDMQGSFFGWQSFGAYSAMAVMIVYVGRRYYWQTTKQAFLFSPQKETDPAAVHALRLFALCTAGAMAILVGLGGLDWTMALLAWIFMALLALGCARVNAECGLFFFGAGWRIPGVMIGLFGLSALGPGVIIVLGMMMYLIQVDVFESMMPFVVNGLKITSDAAVRTVGRTGLILGAGLLLTIAVAVPTALWADYHHPAAVRRGGDGSEIWDTAQRAIAELSLTGESEAGPAGVLERWSRMRPDKRFLAAAAIGFFAFLLVGALRLRYPWWPLHPIIVLAFGTGLAGRFGFSFFLGWAIKMAVTKYGGGHKYTQVKPLMLGVIIGDLAGGFAMMAINSIYYAATGIEAPSVWRTLLW